MNKSALVMFSGGLDSLLTIHILQKQGIDVTALTYETPFFKATKARALADHYGIKHIIRDISDPHFELVKNPKNGYGKNMNPCVDCHGLMFKIARGIADEIGISIIASGEVFGQRPFSQNKEALKKVKAIAGCDILRPLSAKLLDITIYEKDGLVDREKLYDISGKNRQKQLDLVNEYGIDKFTTPGGGCILTTVEYSNRLREFLNKFKDNSAPIDAEIMKYGRPKIFKDGSQESGNKSFTNEYYGVMGRRHDDNEKLLGIFSNLNNNYLLYKFEDIPGPTVILMTFGKTPTEEIDKQIFEWMRKYTKDEPENMSIQTMRQKKIELDNK